MARQNSRFSLPISMAPIHSR